MRPVRRFVAVLAALILLLTTGPVAWGTAGGMVSGRVLDPQGNPIDGAGVEIIRQGVGTVAATETSSAGSFSAPVGVDRSGNTTAFSSALGWREALSWQPPGGGVFFNVNPTANITLRPERSHGPVQGTVQDEVTGRPIGGARVDLHRMSGGSLYGVGLQGSVRTDPNGRYVFAEVPDDGVQGYEAQVLADGYNVAGLLTGVGANPTIRLWPAFVPVVGQVVDSATGLPILGAKVDLYRVGLGLEESTTTYATGDFVLNPRSGSDYQLWVSYPKYRPLYGASFTADAARPPQFTGSKALRLVPELARVSGTVTEAGTGDPVVSATVELFARDVGRLAATISDVNGYYALDGVWADLGDEYWVEATPATSQWGFARSGRFRLPGGSDKTANVTAPRASTEYGEIGVIAGQIWDATGGNFTGVSLTLRRIGTNRIYTGTSGTGGAFRFEVPASRWDGMDTSLPSSGYLLTIDDSRYITSRLAGASPNTIDPITVRPGATTTVNIWTRPSTITLRGKITDEAGQPVPSAKVSLDTAGFPAPSGGSDDSGQYFITGIPTMRASIYVPVVSRDGFLPNTSSALSARDRDLTANLTIRRSTGKLVGNVKDTNDAPVQGAAVRVDLAGTNQTWETQTQNDGTYRMAGLPVGTGANLIVRGFKTGYYGISMRQINVDMVNPVSLRPGETATADLRATSTNGIVRGRVFTDTPLRPAAGATVYLRQEGYGYNNKTNTDADGNFSFDNLPVKYRYAVRAYLFGYVPGDIQVQNNGSASSTTLYPNQPLRIPDIKLVKIPVRDYELPDVLPGAPPQFSGPVHPPAYTGIFANAGSSRTGMPTVLRLWSQRSYAIANNRATALPVSPYVSEGRTLVPLRFIGQVLGATVDYEATDRKVTYTLGDRTVKLWIDQTRAEVGGEATTMDVAPVIKDGRTMVPLRFVGSALGAAVEYDSQTGTIWVTYQP